MTDQYKPIRKPTRADKIAMGLIRNDKPLFRLYHVTSETFLPEPSVPVPYGVCASIKKSRPEYELFTIVIKEVK